MTATSPTIDATTTDETVQPDPYRYGWRYVRRDLPDGNFVIDQVPLTLEDVLHPQEGDQVTHSDNHQRRCIYLYNVLRARTTSDPSAVVLHDVRVKWDTPEPRVHGPDIMVIFGVRERKNWSTFDVAEEGVRPALIIEVVSPEYASIDRAEKLEEYDVAGVPLNVIVDTVQRGERAFVRLLGYRQTPTAYIALAPDERGWLWLEQVRLWLGVRDNEVYCFDETGVQLGDYAEVAAASAAAEARAEAEAQARAAAEAQLRELEDELRRLRGEG